MVSWIGWACRYVRIARTRDAFRSRLCLEDRANGNPLHDRLHLIKGEAIRASWVTVAEGAGEVALVGESQSERNAIGQFRNERDRIRFLRDVHSLSAAKATRATCCATFDVSGLRILT
jgi:hypothetical protein